MASCGSGTGTGLSAQERERRRRCSADIKGPTGARWTNFMLAPAHSHMSFPVQRAGSPTRTFHQASGKTTVDRDIGLFIRAVGSRSAQAHSRSSV